MSHIRPFPCRSIFASLEAARSSASCEGEEYSNTQRRVATVTTNKSGLAKRSASAIKTLVLKNAKVGWHLNCTETEMNLVRRVVQFSVHTSTAVSTGQQCNQGGVTEIPGEMRAWCSNGAPEDSKAESDPG